MANGSRAVLDHQTENEIIEAITALDWDSDVVSAPLRIIQRHLPSVGVREVIDVFVDFQRRNLLICRPERAANNLIESGEKSPLMRGRWVKGDEEFAEQ